MFSLLMLSMMLSAPAAAVQTPEPSDDPIAEPPQAFVLVQPNAPLDIKQEPLQSFDAMEIHPESDVCYKIRAFVFSTGRNPKLLRETTCGPNRASTKQTEGYKPKLLPLNVTDKPADSPQK